MWSPLTIFVYIRRPLGVNRRVRSCCVLCPLLLSSPWASETLDQRGGGSHPPLDELFQWHLARLRPLLQRSAHVRRGDIALNGTQENFWNHPEDSDPQTRLIFIPPAPQNVYHAEIPKFVHKEWTLFTKPPQKCDHGLKLETFILTRRDGSSYEGP